MQALLPLGSQGPCTVVSAGLCIPGCSAEACSDTQFIDLQAAQKFKLQPLQWKKKPHEVLFDSCAKRKIIKFYKREVPARAYSFVFVEYDFPYHISS